MFPLPVNPTVVVQLDTTGNHVVRVASNIAPIKEMSVVVTKFPGDFDEAAKGKTFNEAVE